MIRVILIDIAVDTWVPILVRCVRLAISSEAACDHGAACSIGRANDAIAGVDPPAALLIPFRAIGEAHVVVYTIAVSAALLKSVVCADGYFCGITAVLCPVSANVGSRHWLLLESHVLIEVNVLARDERWICR
jgi:hypothetical protein